MISSRGFLTTSHTISVAINEVAISVDIVKLDAVLRRWVIKLGFCVYTEKGEKDRNEKLCVRPTDLGNIESCPIDD